MAEEAEGVLGKSVCPGRRQSSLPPLEQNTSDDQPVSAQRRVKLGGHDVKKEMPCLDSVSVITLVEVGEG